MAWDALIEAISITFTIPVLGGVLAGLVLGLVFGAIPGLTATLGIVLLLPFVWTMSPFVAFAIMLSLVSAVHTSNTFPAFFLMFQAVRVQQPLFLTVIPWQKTVMQQKG